ncbi:MAG: peptidoglycan-binding domain-containing protein [Pseudomonadota bacterium]
MKRLKNGSKGSDVKALQTALNKSPVRSRLKVDGKFGSKTEEAVKAFQKKTRLKVTGVAETNTLTALGIGGKTLSWPYDDLLQERREVDKHYVAARKVVKVNIAKAAKHKAYSVRTLKEEMERANKTLDKVYAGVVDPLSNIGFLEQKFDRLAFSEVKKREAFIAQAKKTMSQFHKQSGDFYGHIIEIGRIEGQIKSGIDKRSRVVWPVPEYERYYKRNIQRFKAVKERLREIDTDCYNHKDPEVRAFAEKAMRTLSATDSVYVDYEVQFLILNDVKKKFERYFNTKKDDDLLKIGEEGKKEHARLLAQARKCIAQLKLCWEIEKHHRKLIGFAA